MNRIGGESLTGRRWRNWFRRYGLVLVAYLLATWFTDADFMGDTVDYVSAIVAMNQGHNYFFWEFAHLSWRPFGWLFSWAFTPLTRLVVGDNLQANVTFQLLTLSWLAGLLSVFLIQSLVTRLWKREWIASVVTIALVFSQGFLIYAQSGSSYVPGLSLLLLGLYILVKEGDKPERFLQTGLLAGAALAGSVSFWVTYVLALPAALAASLFLFGFDRQRLRLVLLTSLSCAVIIGLAYALVLAHLGIYNLTDLRAWMAASSDAAYIPRGGVPRMVFSLARSFINMGNDGVLFKRFLLQDPLNPVSSLDLFRFTLWKVALFYLFLGAIVVNLLRTMQGRRLLGLLILSCMPVMALALLLEGGAVDRYLPLYPFIFLSLAHSLSSDRSLRPLNFVALGFCGAMIITNSSVLATPVISRQQEQAAARIRELHPQLKPQSLVVTVNLRDELVNFNRSFPLNPLNLDKDHRLQVASVIAPGSAEVSQWREVFAERALKVWKSGGDLWVSKRVLSPRPQPKWGWVEGDDPRVSWNDVYTFFSKLEMGQSVGGEDGFVLLLRSSQTEELFGDFARSSSSLSKGVSLPFPFRNVVRY